MLLLCVFWLFIEPGPFLQCPFGLTLAELLSYSVLVGSLRCASGLGLAPIFFQIGAMKRVATLLFFVAPSRSPLHPLPSFAANAPEFAKLSRQVAFNISGEAAAIFAIDCRHAGGRRRGSM